MDKKNAQENMEFLQEQFDGFLNRYMDSLPNKNTESARSLESTLVTLNRQIKVLSSVIFDHDYLP